MHHLVEDGRDKLIEWMQEEDVKREIARQGETEPHVDPFGHDVTEDDPDRLYQ